MSATTSAQPSGARAGNLAMAFSTTSSSSTTAKPPGTSRSSPHGALPIGDGMMPTKIRLRRVCRAQALRQGWRRNYDSSLLGADRVNQTFDAFAAVLRRLSCFWARSRHRPWVQEQRKKRVVQSRNQAAPSRSSIQCPNGSSGQSASIARSWLIASLKLASFTPWT